VDFKFDIDGSFEASLEPLDFLTGWANVSDSFGLPEPFVLDILHVDTNNLSGSWPILPGIVTFDLSWPDVAINSPSSLSGSESDHIAELNVDVDAAAISFFPLLAPLDPVPGSDDDWELLAIDLKGFVDLTQELKVKLDGLDGTLTFEDGSPPIAFEFGAPLSLISNVSDHDTTPADGKVDFNLSITPDATLSSSAAVGFSVGVAVEVFNNFPFDMGLELVNEKLPIGDLTAFNDTFALGGLASQSWDLFV
jgi:hypothetical protein